MFILMIFIGLVVYILTYVLSKHYARDKFLIELKDKKCGDFLFNELTKESAEESEENENRYIIMIILLGIAMIF